MSNRETIEELLQKERYDFSDLADIMRILRSDAGCPWDREQDHKSIRVCLIEETYEVAEAIDNEDAVLLREELGDLLFQIYFHAQIEAEKEAFDLSDVVDDISKKMIHRHPHVFGSVSVKNSGEVLDNWESIKTEEKQRNTLVEKLRAIPPMMPALMRASKVGKKAGHAKELGRDALLSHLSAQIEQMKNMPEGELGSDQIGELLLTVTDLSRTLGIDAEHALMKTTDALIDEVAKREEA